jgi:hypothetical protein
MQSEIKVPSKDETIVRQSQMQRAIEIYTLIGEKPSLGEVCRLSQLLTEFIFTWDYKSKGIKDFDAYFKLESKEDLHSKLQVLIEEQLKVK